MIQKVFLDSDWDKAHLAREARDQYATSLEQQGYLCQCLTLYRVTDGLPVFFVEAEKPEPDPEPKPRRAPRRAPRPSSASDRSSRSRSSRSRSKSE